MQACFSFNILIFVIVQCRKIACSIFFEWLEFRHWIWNPKNGTVALALHRWFLVSSSDNSGVKKTFNISIQRRRLTAKQRKKLLAKQKVTQASKSSSALGAGWSNWTPFASCSGVCGAGSTLRRRFCKNAAVGSSHCPGAAVERKECTVRQLILFLDSTSF